jgi:hypothetical protein
MRPKGFFMAAPVGNQPPAVPLQQPQELVRPGAPLGAGAAPTTMQSAAPAAPAPGDIGYVETALIFIKNLLVKLFSMIFFCFKKDEEQPPVPPQPNAQHNAQPDAQQPPAERPAPVEPELPQPVARVMEDINLLNEFSRLPEDVQNRIYTRIGADRHFHFLRRGNDLEAGRAKVQANPQILYQYLIFNNP